MDKEIKKILVMKLGGIGDILLLTPSLKALKKRFPGCSITLMTQPNSASIIKDSGWVDDYIFSDLYGYVPNDVIKFRFYRAIWRLFKILRKKNFDIFLEFHDLSGNLSSIFKPAIISYMCKAPRRIGFGYKKRGFFLTDTVPEIQLPKIHETKYLARIVKKMGAEAEDMETEIRLEKKDMEFAQHIFEEYRLNSDYTVVVHPGANFQTRRLEIHKFISLIDIMAHEFNRKIIIVGSPNEADLGEKIISSAYSRPINLIGKTSVKQLAAIIKKSELFIGNDSGPLHIAVAVKTPAIGILGPSEYERIVYRNNDKFKFVRKETNCSPCYIRRCEKHVCMKAIAVEDVLEKIKDFLKDKKGIFPH